MGLTPNPKRLSTPGGRTERGACAFVLLVGVAILLAGCSEPASEPGPAQSPRVVEPTMTDDMAFAPARIDVGAGETISFRIRNVSKEPHEAYIGSEEEQRLHQTKHYALSAAEQTTAGHMGYGVHVAPFGTAELTSVFRADTEYLIGCHYPGHFEAGMRAIITVTD